MIHLITVEQTATNHWFARCSCSWISPKYPKLSEAERAGTEHTRAHNEGERMSRYDVKGMT